MYLGRRDSLSVTLAMLCAITAVQMALVTVGNITDYHTNADFVRHVLAMDTTFGSPRTAWRAVTDHRLVTVAYCVIIVWEAVTTLALVGGVVAWIRWFFAGKSGRVARRLSVSGWLMQVVLFAGGFLAVGGEWFHMWQSSEWNGLESAMRYLLVALAALVLAHLQPPAEPVKAC